MSHEKSDFELLRDCANEFCEAIGLRKDLFLEIYKVNTDWAFIIQIDALLETSTKHIIAKVLKLEVNGANVGGEEIEKFVNSLNMNGRTSLTNLLRASKLDADICDFIRTVREVRNAFVHDIHQIDASLLEVLESKHKCTSWLRKLSFLEKYDEAEWTEMIRNNGELLRHQILRQLLVFFTLAYHAVIREKPSKN